MKLGFIISASVAAIVGLALLLPSFLFGTVPSAEIYPRPNGQFELVNASRHPIYFTGYSPSDCVMSARFAAPGKLMPGVGLCGTGLGHHRIDPGASAVVSAFLPRDAYSGEKVVVTCHLNGRVSGWKRLQQWAASEVPILRRFVSPVSMPSIVVETEGFVPVDPTKLTAK